ncbi:MAG TPA: response regulator [Thermodesulfovibrionales bacterium]|nr:response regulator [Thermodesulfovibrionales bacterium]
MRKPRVLIFDDNIAIIRTLEDFFKLKGYEVFSYTEPITCPLYERGAESCDKSLGCADIVITDLHMPRMTGAELLRRQKERGCRLGAENKIIMSAYMAGTYEEMIKELGCSFFYKPSLMSALPDWLKEREKHFVLSEPLDVLESVRA